MGAKSIAELVRMADALGLRQETTWRGNMVRRRCCGVTPYTQV